MSQIKTDLRVRRTRKSIMDAFISLSEKKEFKDITIKDITNEAMINRATFYYHFEDIYDLLEKVLSKVLLINLDMENFQNQELNEETLIHIFKAITNFQKSLSRRCHRGYPDTIGRIIREQLEIIFYSMLLKQHEKEPDEGLKLTAVMLSWGIYGASVEWRRSGQDIPPEQYIQSAIPYFISGIHKNHAHS